MYQQFYGLHRPPFAVTPDPGLLYLSPAHREALATIIYGVETRKGFLVCTGEVGTGKTTVVRAFFDQAESEKLKVVYVFTPQAAPLEMATHICRELGVPEPDSVFAAMPPLQLKLLEIFENGRTVVLMIDEAQLLPVETIEFLRLLSNFETDTEKLIQIVLVGQPELDTVLARNDMRQVSQRVALRARLRPLTFEESLAYIDHRLSASGAEQVGQVLSSSAARLIAEAGHGIPRRINILADNVLIAGFGAGQRPVGSQLASATLREFAANSAASRPSRPRRRFGLWRPEPDLPRPAAPAEIAPLHRAASPEPAPIEPIAAESNSAEPTEFEPIFVEPVPQIAPDPSPSSPSTPRARVAHPLTFVRTPTMLAPAGVDRTGDPFAKAAAKRAATVAAG